MPDAISHYRIEGEIGRGGMGVVYRAVDTRLGRPVAIKVLPSEATADAERHRRFVREAQSASALNHPNIVTIYEIGEDAGTTFIAMELVDGTPLDRLLAQGPLAVATALDYAVQIASALAVAHAGGIIHRDIKPANIVITRDGRAKVLDFGLAKLIELASTEATLTAVATEPGIVMGTAAYMSPEQAEARPVDARSDIFSFGAVLYEMLAGRRPFSGSTHVGVITSILRDQPPPVRTARPDAPADVDAIIQRALAKDPAARYQTAAAMRVDLAAAHAKLTRLPESAWRRPAVLIPVVLALVAAVAFGVWQMMQARRARWARQVAIPEIERLQLTDRSLEAVRLARQAEHFAPEEIARVRDSWFAFETSTDPPGAEVSIRNYVDTTGAWEALGTTPVQGHAFPQGYYRLRVRKAGYQPLDISYSAGRPTIKLMPENAAEPGMVFVERGEYRIGVTGAVQLPDYWIDQYELTNREFKRFVDVGGYRDPKYWKEPFRDGTRTLTFEQSMVRFRDTTDRSGPATWELGSYAAGQEDFPVGGISWFEAAAYAEFAGKSLPTLYHWYRVAGTEEIFSDTLLLSNFDAKGPAKIGEKQGVGWLGTFDMAGNMKEWCVNEAGSTSLRYILGGGWNEGSYRFRESEARNPWDRAATFGVRLIKDLGPSDGAAAPVAHVYGDPQSLVPVSDKHFALLRRFYDYDRSSLDARVESTDDGSPQWRKEKVSYAAAYGGERITAYLFLPKNARPPYQTVLFFPSSYAREIPSSDALDLVTFEFIVRSGRALLYPVYYGTFERRKREPPGTSAARDRYVNWAKDVFRSVDYLVTRPDVDKERLGYYSYSLGAFFGPIPVALEPRIKVAVFAAGGLRFNVPPEVHTANFMPRVKIPVLLVNGRDDFSVPPAAQRRFLELLGTPAEHKQLVSLEGGHVPTDMHAFFRATLNWYDKYLGTVK